MHPGLRAAPDFLQVQARQRHRHRAADEQRDEMKNARDLGDQAVAFFKEYVAARADAQKALLFRA